MHFLVRTTLLFFVVTFLCIISNAQENATQVPKIDVSTIKNIDRTTQKQNVQAARNSSQNLTFGADEVLHKRLVTYCTTPNSDNGFCMPIRNCTKLWKQLENKNAVKFLRKSRCGPKNENASNPFVCCGKYDNFKNLGSSDLLPKSCGRQNIAFPSRIFGGTPTVIGEYPWLARLYHKDKAGAKVFGCTGFLISSKFVLTAGHCLQSENVDVLGPISEVQLGEHDTQTDPDCDSNNICADKIQTVKVNGTAVHHSYNMSSKHHHHDIGLIMLKKSVKVTKYVSPICLPEKVEVEPTQFYLSGWGTTETGSLSRLKLKVSVPYFPHSNCSKEYSKLRVKVIDKQLCAGGQQNKDSCTGDSGGPLMLVGKNRRYFAVGVVSYGLGCGRKGWPAIYTNVTSYNGWIQTTMSKLAKNPKLKTKFARH